MQPIFITGIGTGIGKTFTAAVLCKALQANYWKPIQAGIAEGTDSKWIKKMCGPTTTVFNEVYKLDMPASPHIAAQAQGITIKIKEIVNAYQAIKNNGSPLLIEGAGGLMVPLNKNKFVVHLIQALNAKVILVSKNYLGSINHSLLTAALCKQYKIAVAGWVFNDHYLHYENEIAQWSKYPNIGSLPFIKKVNAKAIATLASQHQQNFQQIFTQIG